MTSMSAGEPVIVFDLGMVLSTPTRLYESLADLLHTTPAAVEEAFWAHRHAYDEGSSDQDFWGATVPLLGLEDVDLTALVPQLVAADIAGWATPRPAARQILADLRDQGRRTAVLSNAPTSFANASPTFDWYSLIGTWVFSGHLGFAKPAPAIYEHVETLFGVTGDQLWFVDDKPVNVDAAAARGWHAHLWSDDTDTRAWLVGEGFLQPEG